MINIRERSQPLILAPLMLSNLVYYTSFLAAYYVIWMNVYIIKGVVFPIVWTTKKVAESNKKVTFLRRTQSSPGDLQSHWKPESFVPLTKRIEVPGPIVEEPEKEVVKEVNAEESNPEPKVCCEQKDEKWGVLPEENMPLWFPSDNILLNAYQRAIDVTKTVLEEAANWFSLNLKSGKMTVYHYCTIWALLSVFGQMHLSMLIGRGVFKVKPSSLVKLYTSYPLKSMSRLWGYLNKLEIPVWLRTFAYTIYSTIYGVKLSEAEEQDLTAFPNLCAFFQRSLKPGIRPVADTCVTSPADGRVLHLGPVDGDLLEQVKGVTYSLDGFFGPQSTSEEHKELVPSDFLENPADNKLFQCIIYLAPGDYHKYHSPADWTVSSRRHFPGELFSVQPTIARWLKGLFSLNERAVYQGRWKHGFFSMSPVGAVNVGSINVVFDKDLETNTGTSYAPGTYYDAAFPQEVEMKKGDLYGDFNLGSTIVLIFEAPKSFAFSSECKPGSKVQYGQALGSCNV